MKKNLRIFAFGGNEVSPTGAFDPKTGKALTADIPMQWRKTAETCAVVADIIQKNPDDLFIITHGNGPQVGNILLRAEYSRPILHPLSLDICGADTQGSMAYMIAQLNNELCVRGIDKKICGIVTQIVVDKNDPDFKDPSKFIGPAYSKEQALERAARDGWKVKCYKKDESGGEIWRKVVPSPAPKDILEIEAVEAVLSSGMIPVTVGGGGIPVAAVEPVKEGSQSVYKCNYGVEFKGKSGCAVYTGVEAVIDKDLASALLGVTLLKRAQARGQELDVTLVIFTGEDGAKLDYQKPEQKDLRKLTVKEAEEIFNRKPCPFPPGSMGPKIKAAIEFVKNGGSAAYITKTGLYGSALKGEAGTVIVP